MHCLLKFFRGLGAQHTLDYFRTLKHQKLDGKSWTVVGNSGGRVHDWRYNQKWGAEIE